jgi:hypothetical protein
MDREEVPEQMDILQPGSFWPIFSAKMRRFANVLVDFSAQAEVQYNLTVAEVTIPAYFPSV